MIGQFLRRASIFPEGFLSSIRIKRTTQPVDKDEVGTVPVETSGAPGGVLQSDVDVKNIDECQLDQLEMVTGETFPVLVDRVVDDTWNIPVNIAKSIVKPSDAIPLIPSGYAGEVERQALDRWASLQFVSSIDLDDLPAPQTTYFLTSYNFPNSLTGCGVLWENTSSDSGNAEGVLDTSDWQSGGPGETAPWRVQADAEAAIAVSGSAYADIIKGPGGLLKAKLVRTFLHESNLPTEIDLEGNYVWKEVYGSIIVFAWGQSFNRRNGYSGYGDWKAQTSGGIGGGIRLNTSRYEFGPVVHGGNISLVNPTYSPTVISHMSSGGSTPGGGTYPAVSVSASGGGSATLKLPASGTALPASNTWVLVSWETKPWRWGIWVQEQLYIKMP